MPMNQDPLPGFFVGLGNASDERGGKTVAVRRMGGRGCYSVCEIAQGGGRRNVKTDEKSRTRVDAGKCLGVPWTAGRNQAY